jgi:hypothetical protein
MPYRNDTNHRSSTKRVKVIGAIAYPNLIALIGEGEPMTDFQPRKSLASAEITATATTAIFGTRHVEAPAPSFMNSWPAPAGESKGFLKNGTMG